MKESLESLQQRNEAMKAELVKVVDAVDRTKEKAANVRSIAVVVFEANTHSSKHGTGARKTAAKRNGQNSPCSWCVGKTQFPLTNQNVVAQLQSIC